MKTAKSILIVLFTFSTAQMASAYYCPSDGHWLSRDHLGEPGFENIRTAGVVSPAIMPSSHSARWLNRDPMQQKDSMNLYEFANNNAINTFDILGNKCCLLTWKPHPTWSWPPFEWGHSALKCDNAYVSAWPSSGNGSPISGSSPVFWQPSQSYDDSQEGRPPDSVICSDCINGDQVAAWFAQVRGGSTWNATTSNCADYTLQALIAGLTPQKKPCCSQGQATIDLMRPVVNFPASVASSLNALNSNGCNRYKCTTIGHINPPVP